MALDLQALPYEFINDLKERGHSEEDISKMTPERAFTEYCNWQGLINWGDSLWLAVQKFKNANMNEEFVAISNNLVQEVKAYQVTIYECECPFCEANVRVADDDGLSEASFEQKCTECGKAFPVRCE